MNLSLRFLSSYFQRSSLKRVGRVLSREKALEWKQALGRALSESRGKYALQGRSDRGIRSFDGDSHHLSFSICFNASKDE